MVRHGGLGGGGRARRYFKTRELPDPEGAVVRPGPGGAVHRLGRKSARAARRFVRDRPRPADAPRRTPTRVGRLRDG